MIGDGAPVVVLVWNNHGYGEIRTYMIEAQIRPEGVDLTPPDFTLIARAYGLESALVESADAVPEAVAAAIADGRSTVIEARGV